MASVSTVDISKVNSALRRNKHEASLFIITQCVCTFIGDLGHHRGNEIEISIHDDGRVNGGFGIIRRID